MDDCKALALELGGGKYITGKYVLDADVVRRFQQANPGVSHMPIQLGDIEFDWSRYVYKLPGVEVPVGAAYPQLLDNYGYWVETTHAITGAGDSPCESVIYRCPVEDWCDDCGRPRVCCSCCITVPQFEHMADLLDHIGETEAAQHCRRNSSGAWQEAAKKAEEALKAIDPREGLTIAITEDRNDSCTGCALLGDNGVCQEPEWGHEHLCLDARGIWIDEPSLPVLDLDGPEIPQKRIAHEAEKGGEVMRWIVKNGKVYSHVNVNLGNGRSMQITSRIADCSVADDPSRTADFIAAAPEMLAMLKDIEELTPCTCSEAYASRGMSAPDCPRCMCGPDWDAVLDLIARAEGREDVHKEG